MIVAQTDDHANSSQTRPGCKAAPCCTAQCEPARVLRGFSRHAQHDLGSIFRGGPPAVSVFNSVALEVTNRQLFFVSQHLLHYHMVTHTDFFFNLVLAFNDNLKDFSEDTFS